MTKVVHLENSESILRPELVRERDELRAILRDVVEQRGLALTVAEAEALERLLKMIKADGCYECAFGSPESPTISGFSRASLHHHHPNDRASVYRMMLSPGLKPERAALMRILEVLVKAGPT